MATSKKASSKKAPRKASAKKAAAKTSAKKESATRIDVNRIIKGVPGQDEHFYKKFPRYAAYQTLINAPKRQMKVGTFLEKIEKLEGVKNRKQAVGIVQKLVDKKRHVGAVCAQFV